MFLAFVRLGGWVDIVCLSSFLFSIPLFYALSLPPFPLPFHPSPSLPSLLFFSFRKQDRRLLLSSVSFYAPEPRFPDSSAVWI